jgi:hypothetical protein
MPHATDNRITQLKPNYALTQRINFARNIHSWRERRLEL